MRFSTALILAIFVLFIILLCGFINIFGDLILRCNNVHMLIEIPPKMSVSGFMGYLKGKSSQMIYEQFANARYKYRSREFWCRGYYVDTVGKNTNKIKEYIANQLKEDQIAEQMELKLEDPFTGKKR